MTRTLLLLSVLSLGLIACDETDTDTRSDQERIVGTWDASAASLNVTGVPIPLRVADLSNAEDEQTFTFGADGRFSFVFDPQDGRALTISAAGQSVSIPLDQTVRLAGTYSLDESTDRVTFSTIANQTADDFQMDYGFSGANLDLEAQNNETLVRLFGFASEALERLAGFIEGGQITYQKAGA